MSANDCGEIDKICGREGAVFVGTDVGGTAEGAGVAVVVGGDLGEGEGLIDNGRYPIHYMQIPASHVYKPAILGIGYIASCCRLSTVPV